MNYSIKDFQGQFPNDEACLEYIFNQKYDKTCKCGGQFYRSKTRKCYNCSMCGKQISPLAGTIFEKSDTPLTSWFYAIFLFSSARNGVSAKELERQLGVTYKTAWRIAFQIRQLMQQDKKKLSGVVEVDETYIGGYRRK